MYIYPGLLSPLLKINKNISRFVHIVFWNSPYSLFSFFFIRPRLTIVRPKGLSLLSPPACQTSSYLSCQKLLSAVRELVAPLESHDRQLRPEVGHMAQQVIGADSSRPRDSWRNQAAEVSARRQRTVYDACFVSWKSCEGLCLIMELLP